jgi:beta-lactamase class D
MQRAGLRPSFGAFVLVVSALAVSRPPVAGDAWAHSSADDQTAGSNAALECFVLSRPGEADRVSGSRECAAATAPASTFKIPHALIALETGVVTPATIVKWDGTPRDFETWRRDHNLDSSIRWSVYPFFQHTARLIGRDRMKQSLGSLAYAADTFDGELTTFWNTGDLVVTPIEQVAFLRRLMAGKLPIDARHVATVRQALRMPAGQITNAAGTHTFALTWPKSASVHAKTGNTTVNGERVSWLVGWVTLDGVDTVFAGRIRAKGTLGNTAGAEVALRGLNESRTKAR